MEAAEDPGAAKEIKRLQRCMNDLLSLLALPAIWSGGGDAAQIARVLADTLLGMLRLDFVYVQLREHFSAKQIEVMSPALQEIPAWLNTDPRTWPTSVVSLNLGLHDQLGTIVAGSSRSDFPHEAERLVLNVAANQTAIALQDARGQSEQRRLAEELDRRVAQRTVELAAANEKLKAEIAERRRAEAALRDSEANLRKIINTLPATAWSTRPDGYCDFLSQRWLEYAGFTAEQAEGWGWSAVIHPDDSPGLVKQWQASLATGAPIDEEARMRRADGTYRWFLFRANPLRAEDGTIARWYGTNLDIEDRKRAREELLRREHEARLVVDCIPAYVAVLGSAGEIIQVNRRLADFFGARTETIVNWRTDDTVHPDDLPSVRAALIQSFTTGVPFAMENRLRRYDGEYRWFQARALPLRDANERITTWYFAFADIHERRQAEESLRRSEAFLAEAQRISSTGSFSWWLDTDALVFSDELYRIFELEVKSGVRLQHLASLVHADDRAIQSNSLQYLQHGGEAWEDEVRLRFPDGRIKHLHTSYKVIRHENGRRECLGAVQDVTQRNLSTEALDKARSELAHINRSMSLGALTASIAHEVNQPLSGIVTNASTCVRFLTAEPPNIAGALETARRTIRDGNRAADIIARLRALFNRKDTATETVDLNDAAREVISLLSRDLQRSRVLLEMELDDTTGPLLVTGDRVQLQQVILNLVRNASEAMNEVYDRPRQLVIKTEREQPNCIRLSVRDVGVGLDITNTENVFDAFYTTKNDSMGVGLSVSRSIIEGHHGRLWAVPNEGPGATFAFSIQAQS